MWTSANKLKLVTRKFEYDGSIDANLVNNIKAWLANVAGKNAMTPTFAEYEICKRLCGAFSFCASDADDRIWTESQK